MSEILCSTGALIGRPNGRDYQLLKELSEQLTCDGFEFMMYSNWYEVAEQLVEDLREMQLYIPVVHCQKSVGEAISKGGEENFRDAFDRFAVNCKIARELGAKKMVMHLWDGITSDANFENNLLYSNVYRPSGGNFMKKKKISNKTIFDYEGIEKWATKKWKANKKGTIEYVQSIEKYKQKIHISFIKVLAHSGDLYNDMADSLNSYVNENYIYQMKIVESEFKMLQSQINPHFLYNCFSNISSLCKLNEMEKAQQFTSKLSTFFLYITRNNETLVRLKDEYNHIFL